MFSRELDVTVVVTCFNHQAYVEQCLASIAAEDPAPSRIIVVDDRSSDDSVAVIRHWLASHDVDARLIARERNGGVCAAMNDALAATETPFFRHISADDWLLPGELADHVEALKGADVSIALAVGDIVETDGGGLVLAEHEIGSRLAGRWGADHRDELHHQLLKSNQIPAPGVVLRTEAVRRVGGYDESLVFEDYDMWLRLSVHFGAVHHPRQVAAYRVLQTSLTRAPAAAERFLDSELRSIEKHLGRSRANDEVILERVAKLRTARHDLLSPHAGASSSRGRTRRASTTIST